MAKKRKRSKQPSAKNTKNSTNNKVTLRLVLLGDAGVGKTSLSFRFCDNLFWSGPYVQTMGIEYKRVSTKIGNTQTQLFIYDFAGNDSHKGARVHTFCRHADGVFLVYDVTRPRRELRAMFKPGTGDGSGTRWANYIPQGVSPRSLVYLVGNKCDLVDQRQVEENKAWKVAEARKMQFCEVSAKTGQNVHYLFQDFIRRAFAVKTAAFSSKKSVAENSSVGTHKRTSVWKNFTRLFKHT